MKKPLLSICIPTYNRAEVLNATLNEITSLKEFDEDVEIVISDNCSTDNTQKICAEFTRKFNNVNYYKNEENIKDRNFWKVLTLAHGQYLKLSNDYISFSNEGLKLMKQRIREYFGETLFFLSTGIRNYKNIGTLQGDSVNEFVNIVSNASTFIGHFGIWKNQLDKISDPFKFSDLQLVQLDWTYQILNASNKFVISNEPTFFVKQEPSGSYNWFQIHVNNYFEIMKYHVKQGNIARSTFVKDKSNTLRHLHRSIFYAFIYKPKSFTFDTKGSFWILFKNCWNSLVLYKYLLLYPLYKILFPIYPLLFTNEKFQQKVSFLYNWYW